MGRCSALELPQARLRSAGKGAIAEGTGSNQGVCTMKQLNPLYWYRRLWCGPHRYGPAIGYDRPTRTYLFICQGCGKDQRLHANKCKVTASGDTLTVSEWAVRQ